MGGTGVTESPSNTTRTAATTHHNESDTSCSTLSTPTKDSPMGTVRGTLPLRPPLTTHSRRRQRTSPLGMDTPLLPVKHRPNLTTLRPARQGCRRPPSFAGRRRLTSHSCGGCPTPTGDVVAAADSVGTITFLRVRLQAEFPLCRWSPDRGSTAILTSAFYSTSRLDDHPAPGFDDH